MDLMSSESKAFIKKQFYFREANPATCQTCLHAFNASDGVAYGASTLNCGAHPALGRFEVERGTTCNAWQPRLASAETGDHRE